MTEHKVEPHRVTKPIQLLAAWLVGLFVIDGLFLTSAKLLEKPDWLTPLLVIASVVNVPLFLICIFVLQTRFRPEMQEDAFYSTYINARLTTEKEIEVAQSQLELAQTKDRLESLEENYQRTLETINIESSQRQKLQRTYQVLKQTNQEVAIEILSHDLQTRLQAVIAEAENLASRVTHESSTKQELIRDANKVLHTALVLSTALENYRYAESDEIRFSSVDLKKLLTESIGLYSEQAQRKGLAIRLDLEKIAGESPSIPASPNQLRLAFNNLIENAVRYASRGGKGQATPIRVTGKRAGDFYKIMIENTGLGLTNEEAELVFNVGYVGQSALAQFRSGPGIGLSITKQVIQRHNGDITIESRPTDKDVGREGRGHITLVTVTLPYTRPSGDTTDV